jgi:hypothetical protein
LAIADSGHVRTCTGLLTFPSIGTGGACDT